MQTLIDNMAASIAGYDGGNMLITKNSDGKPNGIKIMDTDDEATAQKILWLNLNGITYSHNGANGPYDTVWSFEQNGFVADWIVTGTMVANIIKGGTLTLGGNENGNGVCRVLDANGNEAARIDANGFHMDSSLEKYKSLEYIYQGISKLVLSGDALTGYHNDNRRFRIPFGADGAAAFDGDAQVLGNLSVYGSAYFAEGWSGTVTMGTSRLTVQNGLITGVS